MARKVIGYQEGDGFLYSLSGASKLFFFIVVSVSAMMTYDTRFIAFVGLGSLILFKFSNIAYKDISFVLWLTVTFALLNVTMVYLFAPHYGDEIYGQSTVLFKGIGSYDITAEELFYLLNLTLKYFCTAPLAILFLMTTNPSQFAASLNQLGIPYKIAYAVSLTLRYVPDLQEEFHIIRLSQEARGLELSQKGRLLTRIKGNLQIILPLIFSSLERIETVATAMELRRFGKLSKRTWYRHQDLATKDYLVMGSALVLASTAILLYVINGGRFYNPFG